MPGVEGLWTSFCFVPTVVLLRVLLVPLFFSVSCSDILSFLSFVILYDSWFVVDTGMWDAEICAVREKLVVPLSRSMSFSGMSICSVRSDVEWEVLMFDCFFTTRWSNTRV